MGARSLTEGFLQGGYSIEESGCWHWQGCVRPDGYGWFAYEGGRILAHRASVLVSGQRIPDGFVVMHVCDNPRCVNPSHLRVGTQRQNIHDMLAKGRHGNSKKTHCKHGHPFDEENTSISSDGRWHCKACNRSRTKKWQQKKKELSLWV